MYLVAGYTPVQFAQATIGGCSLPAAADDLLPMMDYIWSIPGTGLPQERTEEKLIQWLKDVKSYYGIGNCHDALARFIKCKYIVWDDSQLIQRAKLFMHVEMNKRAWEKRQKLKQNPPGETLLSYMSRLCCGSSSCQHPKWTDEYHSGDGVLIEQILTADPERRKLIPEFSRWEKSGDLITDESDDEEEEKEEEEDEEEEEEEEKEKPVDESKEEKKDSDIKDLEKEDQGVKDDRKKAMEKKKDNCEDKNRKRSREDGPDDAALISQSKPEAKSFKTDQKSTPHDDENLYVFVT